MKDPGPNVLEQQIETNRLLALLIAAGPADAALATLAGGGVPIQWPILFYFSNPSSNPFTITSLGGAGTGAISFLDRNSLNAGAGLKLRAPAGTGQWVRAEVDIPETPTRKVRLQVALANGPGPPEADWHVCLSLYDRTNFHRADIYLQSANEEAWYVNSLGADVSLGQFAWSHHDYAWNKVDLSVNFATDMYHSVAVNHKSADLSAEGLRLTADALWPRIRLRFEMRNNSSDHEVFGYVDQVLVTPELYDVPTEPE